MDDKLGREILSQLKALVKAQNRTADEQARTAAALEAANAADPLAMIQGALGAMPPSRELQGNTEDRGHGLPPEEQWRLG